MFNNFISTKAKRKKKKHSFFLDLTFKSSIPLISHLTAAVTQNISYKVNAPKQAKLCTLFEYRGKIYSRYSWKNVNPENRFTHFFFFFSCFVNFSLILPSDVV